MQIISKIAVALRIFFIIFILFLVILLINLFNGIELNSLKIGDFSAQKLYLRLDEKLVLSAQKVQIKSKENYANKEEKISLENFKFIKDLHNIFYLFKYIKIDELIIKNYPLSMRFSGQKMAITSQDFNLFTSPADDENLPFKVQIKDLKFDGVFNIKNHGFIQGQISLHDSHSKLFLQAINDEYFLQFDEVFVKNLKQLEPFLTRLKPKAQEWLLDRLEFEDVTGFLKMTFKANSFFAPLNKRRKIPDLSIDGSFVAQNLSARFNDNFAPARAKNVKIIIKNLDLIAQAKGALADDVQAKEVQVLLKNLLHPDVSVQISSETFSQSAQNLLRLYKIEIPAKWLSGKALSNIWLHFYEHTHEVKVNSKINAKFDLNGEIIDANMQLFADTKVKERLKINGDFQSKNAKITQFNGVLIDNIFQFGAKNLQITTPFFSQNFELNGSYNLAKSEINLKNLAQISIKDKEIIAQIEPLIFKKFDALKTFNAQITSAILQLSKGAISATVQANYELGGEKISDKFLIDFLPKLSVKSQKIDYLNDEIILKGLLIDNEALQKQIKGVSAGKTSDLAKLNIRLKNCKFFLNNLKILLDDYLIEKNGQNFLITNHDKSTQIRLGKNSFSGHIYHLKSEKFNELLGQDFFIGGELAAEFSGQSLNDFSGLINIINAKLAHTKNYANLITALDALGSVLRLKTSKLGQLNISLGSLEFARKNELLHLQNLQILGEHLDASGSGVYHLERDELQLNMHLFALKNTSALLQNLPIINKIIMGRKDARLATQLKISGPLRELKFKNSVATDVLITPFRLIKNVISLPKNLLIN